MRSSSQRGASGLVFTSREFTGTLKSKDVAISMDGKGRAIDNVMVEVGGTEAKVEAFIALMRQYGILELARTGRIEVFAPSMAGHNGGPRTRSWFLDTPTLADCCLVPQIFNGKRFGVNLDGLPLTMAAFDACMALPAFARAQPSACPDNAP